MGWSKNSCGHEQITISGSGRASRGSTDSPRPILDSIFGIYGSAPTCYLSLLARDRKFRFADLDRILYEDRAAGRIRAMRYSLFTIPTYLLLAAYQATKQKALDTRWKMTKLAGVRGSVSGDCGSHRRPAQRSYPARNRNAQGISAPDLISPVRRSITLSRLCAPRRV